MSAVSISGQTHAFQAPLYWSVYEHHIQKEHAGVTENFIPESELMANIDWVDANLKDLGYTTICMDGWGDVSQLNENGYRRSHSVHWEHDFQWWSDTLQGRGMTLGMYGNPLWIHVGQGDTGTLIPGTPLTVSSLIDPNESSLFTWVQVDRAGAEQYVKGYIQYYADMGVKYFRVDFLSWYETGYDHWIGTVGPARTREQYEKALRWMREACDENGMFLSLVMPNLFNKAELEAQYGHMIRINADAGIGTWQRFSDNYRGHRFSDWSQYENAMDGFAYWSQVSGRGKVILDGDFIRINTYETDSEKRSVISAHIMAGGPVSITDQHNTIGNDLWLYQNEEMLALNTDGFVGIPRSSDPTSDSSQVWYGQLSTGEWIVAFFNRESQTLSRHIQYADLGLSGSWKTRDLWQHADLGNLESLSADIPPHGVMVAKISNEVASCTSQSLSFAPIADRNYTNTPFQLFASASSGLTVEYEVAMGAAEVTGDQLVLTGESGLVTVIAKQVGNDTYCAAIPAVQSFEVFKGHQAAMYVAGTFSGWSLSNQMTMVNDIWVAEDISISAGNHELKFANTNNWTGDDWGNASGLAGVAKLATGGGPNISFAISESGQYNINFNDISLVYSIVKPLSAEDETTLPDKNRLYQNHPNPFNPSTTISYGIPVSAHVTLSVYDVRGCFVTTLKDVKQAAGFHNVRWNGVDASGNSVSTGVYFCRLEAGDYKKTIKMVYLK